MTDYNYDIYTPECRHQLPEIYFGKFLKPIPINCFSQTHPTEQR